MRDLYICIFLIACVLTSVPRIAAQTYRLQESSSILKGPSHEILPCPDGEILTITHPGPGDKGPMTVCRFDGQLNELYTHRIHLLSQERYQAAWYSGDRLFLFCTDKRGGLTRYEIDDKTGSLTGQPAPLTGLLGIDSHPQDVSFLAGGSPGGEFHYIVAKTGKDKAKDKIIRGIILDRQGDKRGLFQYSTPAGAKLLDLALVQAGDGTLSMIYNYKTEEPGETGAEIPYHYMVVRIAIDGKESETALSGLPEGDFHYVSWVVDGQTLRFSGLMSRVKKANYTAIVTGSVDPATGSVFDMRQTEIATLMAQAPALQKGLAQNGLPSNLALLRTIALSDGSRIVLFESSGERLYLNRFSPATQNPISALGRRGAFTPISPSAQGVSYYSRGDVYALKLDRNNTPQWLNILSKNQEEQNKVTAIGIGCLADRQDNLHVFFYDSKCNPEACSANPTPIRANDPKGNEFACISITPEGAMKKQFIQLTDNRYRLMPEIVFVNNNDEACFLAVKTRMSFSEELAFGNAGYKLGIIQVK